MNVRDTQEPTPSQGAPQDAMFNLLNGGNADLLANPFPLFALMGSLGAVIPIPFSLPESDGGTWMVTHMEEAVRVLKDHARFTVDGSAAGADWFFGQRGGW